MSAAIVYGGAAGVVLAGLILTIGVTATAWLLLALFAVAIVVGAVDYVRSH